MHTNTPEEVVLIDPRTLLPMGTELKSTVHHEKTPLHLAFSCYVFDEKGRLLITQRASVKKVWPSVWTNSFCGHPMPGESMEDAIARRAEFELGMRIGPVELLLDNYQYITPPYRGIVEHELCPIYTTHFLPQTLHLNPEEVDDYQWVEIAELYDDIERYPDKYSFWVKDQLSKLNLAA